MELSFVVMWNGMFMIPFYYRLAQHFNGSVSWVAEEREFLILISWTARMGVYILVRQMMTWRR